MTITKPLACALAMIALPIAGRAQTYDELPAGYTNSTGPSADPYFVAGPGILPVHLQYAYDTADLPVTVATITELAWHRNNFWLNTMPAGTITMTIVIGTSPNAPALTSNAFATNLAHGTSTVFSGTVSWPSVSKGTGPAPYTHSVMLASPYAYAPGTDKSFVVDVVETASTYVNASPLVDASEPDIGRRFENGGLQLSCRFHNGNYSGGLDGSVFAALNNNGGLWYLRFTGLLPNAAGYMMLSAYGLDRPGPYTLPLDLAPLGAPGCKWTIGFELGPIFPIVVDASGSARGPNLIVPPGLGGDWFYDQSVFLDPTANALGLVVTWPSKWYVGTGRGPSANMLYNLQDTTNRPSGSIFFGRGTHLRVTR